MPLAAELAHERVDEELNLSAAKRSRRIGQRGGQQVRRTQVDQELRDDVRLVNDLIGDDVVGELDGRHKATLSKSILSTIVATRGTHRIDIEVPLRTRHVKVDNDLLEGDLELGQDEVHALAPRAVQVGVEGDPGRDSRSVVASHYCSRRVDDGGTGVLELRRRALSRGGREGWRQR